MKENIGKERIKISLLDSLKIHKIPCILLQNVYSFRAKELASECMGMGGRQGEWGRERRRNEFVSNLHFS